MKHFTIKLFLLFVATAFLVSCGGDDEKPKPDAPTITVVGDVVTHEGTVELGTDVVLTVSVTSPGGFNVVHLTGSVTDDVDRNDLGLDAGTESATFDVTLSPDALGAYSIDFEAVDDNDLTGMAAFSFDVTSPSARVYTAILLAPPLGTLASETFFSTNTGLTYTMAQVNGSTDPLSADIDFGYFYGTSTGATLSDPSSYPIAYGQANWGTLNSTLFKRTALTAATFAEVTTFAAIDDAFNNATAADTDPGIESGLTEGEVLAFSTDVDKTGGSKRGLILVKTITGTDGSTDSIELEILVQESAN